MKLTTQLRVATVSLSPEIPTDPHFRSFSRIVPRDAAYPTNTRSLSLLTQVPLPSASPSSTYESVRTQSQVPASTLSRGTLCCKRLVIGVGRQTVIIRPRDCRREACQCDSNARYRRASGTPGGRGLWPPPREESQKTFIPKDQNWIRAVYRFVLFACSGNAICNNLASHGDAINWSELSRCD